VRHRGIIALLIAVASVGTIAGVVWIEYRADAMAPAYQRIQFAPAALHMPDEEIPEVEERDPIPTSPETRAAFEARYPRQAAATRSGRPGGDHWALLIGINEHLGRVPNNFASREDAERLREVLLDAGWSDDRIVLMTDTDATGTMIREGLSWLARKTGEDSTVVFHYSGHSKKWYGNGGAILDEALWPTDDDFVRRTELAEALDEVLAAQLWGNFATCNAEGFHEAGLGAPGRLFTYSSRVVEKSYEDPAAGYSVWGSFLIADAFWRTAEEHAGGLPTVQDAFAYAAPLAHARTVGQRYGPQTPVMHDDLDEPFRLVVGRPRRPQP
jgi:hypothetical protein